MSKTGKKNVVGWLRSLRVPGNASRADRIGSEGWFDTIAYQPVRMFGAKPQFDCKHVDARERTEGLMERGKAQICPSE